MTETAIHIRSDSACTLWTPWGPQVTSPVEPKAASLRVVLRKLRDAKDRRRSLADEFSSKPECAYEP